MTPRRTLPDLVVADVGNTNVDVAVFAAGVLRARVQLPTRARSARERAARRRMLRTLQWDRATPAILASVAPRAGAWVERWLRRKSRRVHVARWSDPWPFTIALRTPRTVGVDRLANVAGLVARGLRTGIAVDAGTATTIDVLRHGRFVGGLILAGPRLQLAALHRGTDLLPPAVLRRVPALVGRDTASALRAGALHGSRHAIAGIALGLAVFLIWVGPDALWPGYRAHWLFSNSLLGKPASSLPAGFNRSPMVLIFRTLRAVALVPILEEILGWQSSRIRALFEAHGFTVQEWDKVKTDWLTIEPMDSPEPTMVTQ